MRQEGEGRLVPAHRHNMNPLTFIYVLLYTLPTNIKLKTAAVALLRELMVTTVAALKP